MGLNTLDLGLTQEELREHVIERAADRIVEHYVTDREVEDRFSTLVREALNEAVGRVGAETVEPMVGQQVEEVVLQRTNEWGEPKGESLTFREYLIKRAEHYLTERVDYEGRSREEARGGYGWKGDQTRVVHLIDRHLKYSIESAMKDALKKANGAIVGGIEDAVKLKLKEVAEKLDVKLAVER